MGCFLKGLRVALLLLVLFTLLAAVRAFFIPIGFMDFPCFVGYDEARSCLEIEDTTQEPESAGAQMAAFLTTVQAGWAGGGCHHETSDTGVLEIETPALDLRIERQGDTLLVNGTALEQGKELRRAGYWTLSPWTRSFVRLKSVGVVPDCGAAEPHARLVILGAYGTEPFLAKGVAVLLVLLVGFAFVHRAVRRRKAAAEMSELT
jgi:hypothetical protein